MFWILLGLTIFYYILHFTTWYIVLPSCTDLYGFLLSFIKFDWVWHSINAVLTHFSNQMSTFRILRRCWIFSPLGIDFGGVAVVEGAWPSSRGRGLDGGTSFFLVFPSRGRSREILPSWLVSRVVFFLLFSIDFFYWIFFLEMRLTDGPSTASPSWTVCAPSRRRCSSTFSTLPISTTTSTNSTRRVPAFLTEFYRVLRNKKGFLSRIRPRLWIVTWWSIHMISLLMFHKHGSVFKQNISKPNDIARRIFWSWFDHRFVSLKKNSFKNTLF